MSSRNFLVIVDGSKEMNIAIQFACARAKKTDGHIVLASFIKPIDVLRERLSNRGSESTKSLQVRLDNAEKEIFRNIFDRKWPAGPQIY